MQETIKYNQEDCTNHHGVAAVIRNKEGKILMMDHVKFNFWTIPVGKVKPEETVVEGLCVELKEEINILPLNYKEVDVNSTVYNRNGKEVTVIQHIFEIEEYEGGLCNNEPDKHRSIKWMSEEEIMNCDNLSDATKNYLKIIR